MEAGLLGENVTIDLNVWNSPEELLAMVQGGEHDLYAFPLTVVSTLYNKGLDVRLMNVNTWGVTYFMTTDPAFETWADLAGKTVYIPLQSSPPDALTQYFLNEAGLTVGEDVEIVYASTAEVAALLASGEAEYATLIEPQVTSAMSQNSEVRRALSFEEEVAAGHRHRHHDPQRRLRHHPGFIDEKPGADRAVPGRLRRECPVGAGSPRRGRRSGRGAPGHEGRRGGGRDPQYGPDLQERPGRPGENWIHSIICSTTLTPR